MAVKIKGMKKVRRNLDKFVDDRVDGKVIQRALLNYIITAGNYAAMLTPVDTANLINSQFFIMPNRTANGWEAGIQYTANYAEYVHDGGPRNWQKSGAEDQFLLKAFEDNAPELTRDFIADLRV